MVTREGIRFPWTLNTLVSAIGDLLNTEPTQLEDFSKIVEIVKTRPHSEQHYVVSVGSDIKDFMPTSFLEVGIKQSLSVCRIARYFSYPSFRALVESLETDIERLGKVPHNFDDIDKVIEIFSIPQQIADRVFSDIKDKTPLQALLGITENELAKILPIPIGTGFLVGGSHLLTNYHVVPDAETADQCIAQFSFVENLRGATQQSIDYEFDSTLLVSNPSLDYTLVQLKSDMVTRQAGFEFGWIRLVENDENITPGLVWIELEGNRKFLASESVKAAINNLKPDGTLKSDGTAGYTILNLENSLIIWHPNAESKESEEYKHGAITKLKQLVEEHNNASTTKPGEKVSFKNDPEGGDSVIIVQHPKGRQKQIVLNKNEVITNGLYKDFLRYKADADYGSSGSPVFNTRWELVAVHHAAIPQQTKGNNEIECYQGIRTCRIVEDLKRKSAYNSKLKSFIEDFVMTGEQLNYPPLPSALAFDGINDYIDVTQFIQPSENATSIIKDSAQFTIEAWVKPSLSDANTTIFSQSFTEPWYEELSEDSVFGRYLLSLQITPECNVVFSREPLWEVSSANFPSNGLLYPLLPGSQERRKHPLDVLALKDDGKQKEKDDGEQKDDEKLLTIMSASEEQMKSLKIILYCLGFLEQQNEPRESKSYKEAYLNVIDGEFKNTEAAILSFNNTYVELKTKISIKEINSTNYNLYLTPVEKAANGTKLDSSIPSKGKNLVVVAKQDVFYHVRIFDEHEKIVVEKRNGEFSPDADLVQQLDAALICQPIDSNTARKLAGDIVLSVGHTHSIDIPDEAIDIFKRRGQFLGPETNGIRVVEFQHCLKSLDWNNLIGQVCQHPGQKEPPLPNSWLKDGWPEEDSFSKSTSYVVKQLQRAVGLLADGILGSSTLAALEQAKSYKVSSRERLPVGKFSHIAVTFDGKEVQLFINGQLANRRYTGEQSIGHISQALIGAGSRSSAFSSQQSTHNAYFEEAIAEVRLWKKPLLPEAIVERLHRRLTDEESKDEDLLGYWRLEEGRIEDEKDKYNLQFISAEPDNNSSKEKRRLILVEEADHVEKAAHSYHVSIFDELGKMVVDQKDIFSVSDENNNLSVSGEGSKLPASDESNKKLIDQLKKGAWNSNDELAEKENLIEEIAFRCGYDLRSFYVYNSAGNGTPSYAPKSKFQNQSVGDTARVRSACSFPTVPLPFGVKVTQELTLNILNIAFSEVAARDTTITEAITKGITLELWVKHEYGDGDILTGGTPETGLYTLKWIKGKIQLELSLGSNKLLIETQEPVPNSQTWNHIAFSWDASAYKRNLHGDDEENLYVYEVNLYLGGKPQNIIALQAQEVGTVSYGNTYRSIVKFAASNFAIGQQAIRIIPNTEANKNFCCSIAELRVWQVARPYNLIKSCLGQRLNKNTEAPAGLIAYWRFDGEDDFESQINYPELASSSISSQLSQSPKVIISDGKVRQFVDVDDRHWAFEFIEGLRKMGLIGSFVGIDETYFRPDVPMTRRELALILINIFGGKPKSDRVNILLRFKDEKAIGNKYLADIEYVWRLGLMSGDVIIESKTKTSSRISEVTFNPDTEVSRGVAVSVIYDSLREVWWDEGFKSLNQGEGEEILKGYNDTPESPGKFCNWIPREHIAIALKKGLIVHKDPSLKKLDLYDPKDPKESTATRAEIAAMLYQSLVIQDQFYQFIGKTSQQRVKPIESDHILKPHFETTF